MARAILSFLLALAHPSVARATVWTYPAPAEEFRSPAYTVRVTQDGRTQESFVYRHAHQDEHLRDRGTDFNHWTTFSFAGPITVEVTRLSGPAAGAEIRPLSRGLVPTVLGPTLTFTLVRPEKLYVLFPGADEDPLFIFADPPEENIPDRADPQVIWFEAGKVHDIGEKFTIKSGQTVYIPGGAYVKGSITAEGASDITVRGRGILSGLGYARRPGTAGIPFNTVMFNGSGDRQLIEGITVTNPTHFCLLSRGKLTTRHVKLFGWWHQTDGWGGGDGSVIEDSFLKVNDDSVKLYGRDQIARRLVIWQQVNGAPFQLGWGGAGQRATNCLVEDIDLIANEAADKTTRETNQAFLNLRRQSPESAIDGVTLRRIRLDSDVPMLLGFIETKGRVRQILLEDVTVRGVQRGKNFLRTEGAGRIEGITLRNVTVNGQLLTGPSDALWATSGDVAPVRFAPATP
jgi:hypothetical protein